jgi:type I restriction enzyme, R subunit
MTAQRFAESVVEDAALAWLEALGYSVLHGPDIAVGMIGAERSDPNYRDVVLDGRLRRALFLLNPDLPQEALDDAYRKLIRSDAPLLVERNRAMHRMLVDGVTVEYRRKDGSIRGAQARIIDFASPDKNDWLVVNQFTVAEGQHTRRPDVVLFVNGLPLAVIELKNSADEKATVWSAYQQLQTYQSQIPALFANGSSRGVRSPAARTHPRNFPNCRWCSRVCSRNDVSSIYCGTSSCLRTLLVIVALAR